MPLGFMEYLPKLKFPFADYLLIIDLKVNGIRFYLKFSGMKVLSPLLNI